MKVAIDETKRRRRIQEDYNSEHGIEPRTIVKPIDSTLVTAYEADYFKIPLELEKYEEYSPKQLGEMVLQLEHEMREAAKARKFEHAAELRDKVKYIRERQLELG